MPGRAPRLPGRTRAPTPTGSHIFTGANARRHPTRRGLGIGWDRPSERAENPQHHMHHPATDDEGVGARHLLEEALTTMAVAVVVTDTEGRVVFTSDAAREFAPTLARPHGATPLGRVTDAVEPDKGGAAAEAALPLQRALHGVETERDDRAPERTHSARPSSKETPKGALPGRNVSREQGKAPELEVPSCAAGRRRPRPVGRLTPGSRARPASSPGLSALDHRRRPPFKRMARGRHRPLTIR